MLNILYFLFILLGFGECQCPSDYTSIKGGCFKAYNYVNASWDAAQNLCASNQNGHLAIIDSCTLLGDLAVYFHLSGIESTAGYWIGATDREEEGTWVWADKNKSSVVLGVPFWASVQNVNSTTWFLEPSGGVNENCALLSPSDQYFFRDEDCNRGANPLCQTDVIELDDKRSTKSEKSKDLYCDDSDFHYVDGKCFFFKNDTPNVFSWEDAREFCQTKNSSELAILNDCDLFGFLVKFIGTNYPLGSGQSYWIGASDKSDEGAWYWVDNTPVRLGPPLWGKVGGISQPSEDTNANCLDMYSSDNYYFHDGSCTSKSHFICQKDPVPSL